MRPQKRGDDNAHCALGEYWKWGWEDKIEWERDRQIERERPIKRVRDVVGILFG